MRQRRVCVLWLLPLLALWIVPSAMSAEWGDLTGKFVFDGEPPVPAPIEVNRDEQAFGNLGLVDESLLVDPEGGLANVLIYVRTKDVDVHPNFAQNANDQVVLDNKGGRFEPRVLGLRLSQELLVRNPDPVAHNTNISPLGDAGINPLLPPAQQVEHRFNRAQNIPAPVQCNVHPWMKAYVLPRANPYFAVSATDGTFEIEKLPAGTELEFQLWQEKSGYLKDAASENGKLKASERGRFTITLEPGKNDLGDIHVDPKLFDK